MDGYTATPNLLDGIHILEISEGVAGASAGALLRRLGARVTLATWPGGHPLRERPPFAPSGRSLYDLTFNHGKAPASIMPGGEHAAVDLASVDGIILEGTAARVQSLLQRVVDKPVVAITPFGLHGPRKDWKSSELVTQAYAGILFITGDPHRSPVRIGVPLGEYAAGQAAAASLLSALFAADANNRLAEVSIVEAALSIMEHSFATWEFRHEQWVRRGNHGTAAWGIYPCADGYVGVISGLGESWQRFRQLIGGALLDPGFEQVSSRADRSDEIHAAILDWLSHRTRQQAFEEALAARLPFSLLATPDELLGLEQLAARDYWDTVEADGATARLPGAPFQVWTPRTTTAAPQATAPSSLLPLPTAARQGPLHGIRVLDFGIVWAGPHCGRMLADQGADVIKVESARRPDLIRGNVRARGPMAGCYPDGIAGPEPWNQYGYFIERNRNKRDICLDLKTPEGRDLALQLAHRADVVLDNFTAGTMDRLGLGPTHIHAANPGAIVVSMSAYGASGPWRSNAGYGATVDALSGAVALTGYADDEVATNLGINSSDPIAGQHAYLSICASLVARKRDGRGRFIDLSQLESAARLTAVPVLAQQVGETVARVENTEDGFLFSAVLQCDGDERWLAVSCRDEVDIANLLDILQVDTLEAAPAAARTRDRDFLAEALQSRSVAAAPVMPAEEVMEDPQLADYFVHLDHRVVGPRRYLGGPTRWHGRPREFEYRPAPLLGQHTEEVLSEVLGLGKEELARLRDTGVTSNDPLAIT
ncbi:MAG: CoA transferase [Dehalococcoidia bacterium]|nr:CoA transferase [Dehalococcoidia bacterium]